MSPYALDGVPDIKSDLGLQEPLCFSEIIAFLPFSASFHFRSLFVGFQKPRDNLENHRSGLVITLEAIIRSHSFLLKVF